MQAVKAPASDRASVATSSQHPSRGRRASQTPGFYTRAQVEADLGLSATDRDTFERAGILGPAVRRARGDTRPLLYSAADLAVGRWAMSAHQLGIRGEQLRNMVDAVRLKQRRLVHGWSGIVVVDAYRDVEFIPADTDLALALAGRSPTDALLLIPLQVPALPVSLP